MLLYEITISAIPALKNTVCKFFFVFRVPILHNVV
jgi:hypothetical protein